MSMAMGSAPTNKRFLGLMWSGMLVFGSVYLGRQILTGGPMLRVITAMAVMAVLAVPAIENPRKAVLGLFVLLPFMGDIRHAFISSTGAARLDPLLLVTSAVAVMIFVSLIMSQEMDFTGTALSKAVFLLLGVGLLQVFNPEQASVLVGLTGIMINLIPISFFFIARSIADAEFAHKVFKIVLVIGTLGAIYGLSQVFIGFRGFELKWIANGGYGGLTVGNTIRPFSFFNNASEYASYTHYAFCAAFAMLLFAPKTKRFFALGLVVVIFYAGFLIGSRGFTVKVVLAVIILLAGRAKNRMVGTGIVVMLVGGLTLWSMNATSTSTIQSKEAGAAQLTEQQTRALKDPFNRNVSTLPVHYESAKTGIMYTITKKQFGQGVGSTTTAASKFGGQQSGTEFDIGDAFLSLGVIGGVLYLISIMLGITYASRVRKALPGPVWAAIWAMAATSVGAWLVGGNYSITPLIWFLVGTADGEYKRLRDRGLIKGRRDYRAPSFEPAYEA
jgi:hypothetical protein